MCAALLDTEVAEEAALAEREAAEATAEAEAEAAQLRRERRARLAAAPRAAAMRAERLERVPCLTRPTRVAGAPSTTWCGAAAGAAGWGHCVRCGGTTRALR